MTELSKKSLEMNKALEGLGEMLFKKSRIESVTEDKCISCGGKSSVFRDDLSRKEFSISGLCQKCQDKVFGEE
jgi:hypothetical protein